jgi:hypothetical protein
MAQCDDLLDAISRWHTRLAEAAQEREAGRAARAFRAAMMAAVDLLVAGMAEAPSDDDWKLINLYADVAKAFLDLEAGHLPALFTPVAYGSGQRPLTVAEIRYRAWAARASLAQIHAGCDKGVADQKVADATAWVDDDPLFTKRLGGALTKNAVRNERLKVEHNHPSDKVALFARGIPSFVEVGQSAEEQAEWLLVQVASPAGQAC